MFNEENTVEQMVLDALSCGVSSDMPWKYIPAEELPRQHSDVFVESMVRNALIQLNPEIKAQPDLADEVLYRLRAIPLTVQSSGLVRANEYFAEWLRGEKTMPFGENGEHTQIRLIDFENPAKNELIITNQ